MLQQQSALFTLELHPLPLLWSPHYLPTVSAPLPILLALLYRLLLDKSDPLPLFSPQQLRSLYFNCPLILYFLLWYMVLFWFALSSAMQPSMVSAHQMWYLHWIPSTFQPQNPSLSVARYLTLGRWPQWSQSHQRCHQRSMRRNVPCLARILQSSCKRNQKCQNSIHSWPLLPMLNIHITRSLTHLYYHSTKVKYVKLTDIILT